jgi:hypothetical protein
MASCGGRKLAADDAIGIGGMGIARIQSYWRRLGLARATCKKNNRKRGQCGLDEKTIHGSLKRFRLPNRNGHGQAILYSKLKEM